MPITFEPRGRYWWARGTLRGPGGKSLRVYESTGLESKDFGRKADVEAAWETRRQRLVEEAAFGARAVVPFDRAAQSYLNHEPRRERTKDFVDRLVSYFGSTLIGHINQEEADKAVRAILGAEAAPATKIRAVLGPLTAVLMHAHRRKWCDSPKFDYPKVPRPETRWLSPQEALALENAAALHLRPLIRFLLCTGARLSEALDLQWQDVDLLGAKVRLQQKGDRIRVASLPPAGVTVLANQPHRDGHMFRRDDGKPYTDRKREQGGQIKTAWATACERAGAVVIEDGEVVGHAITPHDLRHTWATWAYAATKDLLLLKDEGGWATLAMCERYAHLMASELVADIALVWGPSHPRFGVLPARANSVQQVAAAEKSA